MILDLVIRTGYSFRGCYGTIEEYVSHLPKERDGKPNAVAIADIDGTWGHAPWEKECRKVGIDPIFGVELLTTRDPEEKVKGGKTVILLAESQEGLRNLYACVEEATANFYYRPRLPISFLKEHGEGITIIHVSMGTGSFLPWTARTGTAANPSELLISRNRYPLGSDKQKYAIVAGNLARQSRAYPQHLIHLAEIAPGGMSDDSMSLAEKLANTEAVRERCRGVQLQRGKVLTPEKPKTLRQMVEGGAKERGHWPLDEVREERVSRELALFKEKDFEDYFYIVADLVGWAKKKMPVGPGRGSSCGSLVCYYLGITDIDPIPWGLLLERFVDPYREDYPDIDIDFSDRLACYKYLRKTYGNDRVAKLGTVSFLGHDSAILDICRESDHLNQYGADIVKLKEDCEEDVELAVENQGIDPIFNFLPEVIGHPRQSGIHAAGVIVLDQPVKEFCGVSLRDSAGAVAMVDKRDAETLNLLKLDCLGLRTLIVLEEACKLLGIDYYKDLIKIDMADQKAFDVLNSGKMTGIFQFEGQALKQLAKGLEISSLEDMACLTALARPGPLNSGGSRSWVKRRTGRSNVELLHPSLEPILSNTHGVIVFEEQVMRIFREIGDFPWPMVSKVRRAIKKKVSDEEFSEFMEPFAKGCTSKGFLPEQVELLWGQLKTMGAYAFNRSHAVAYTYMSYYCAWLKAHHPDEFTAATLRSASNDEQAIKMLREARKEGFFHYPVDMSDPQISWSIVNGKLTCGLTAIKGIGVTKANEIIKKTKASQEITAAQTKLIAEHITPFDEVGEGHRLWGHLKEDGKTYGVVSKLTDLDDVEAFEGKEEVEFVFICKIQSVTVKNSNRKEKVEERGYKVEGNPKWCLVRVSDDFGECALMTDRGSFTADKKLYEGNIGNWFIIRASKSPGFGLLKPERVIKLTDNERFKLT